MARHSLPRVQVKAAGGIRTIEMALAVRDLGVARLFNMHRVARPRPVAVRLRSTTGRHEADRLVYRSRND